MDYNSYPGSDKERPRSYQIISELWYLTVVMFFYYFTGIFYSLPVYDKGYRRKIVLITGFWGRTLYWKPMRKRLIELGYSVYTVDLGFQVGDIRKKNILLEEYLIKHDIKDCYMLAHSMGAWIALGLSSKAKERITRMFTISASFQGSYVCHTVPMFTSSRQLVPGAKFIDTQKENLKYISQVKNIFTREDEISVPVETCRTGNPDEVQFPGFGHLNLVMSKAGIDFILEQIKAEENKIRKETAGAFQLEAAAFS
jgi:pimeloyl-ACP methyl ester carboxylesterase